MTETKSILVSENEAVCRLRDGERNDLYFRDVSETRRNDQCISVDVFSIPVCVYERSASND